MGKGAALAEPASCSWALPQAYAWRPLLRLSFVSLISGANALFCCVSCAGGEAGWPQGLRGGSAGGTGLEPRLILVEVPAAEGGQEGGMHGRGYLDPS